MGLFGRLLKREPLARIREGLKLKDIPGAWVADQWVPEWSVVRTWVDQNKPVDQHKEAWRALTGSWLNNLADDLGAPYACYTSENFQVLCPFDDKKAKPDRDFLEMARERLLESFGLQTLPEAPGPVVVLVFYDREEYLSYVSSFGEPPELTDNACGVLLEGGYPHIAIYDPDKLRKETTLAKELMRNLLCHLPVPVWLKEGITRLAPTEMGLGLVLNQMKEIRIAEEAIRECWRQNSIQQFWSGSAFTLPDQRKKRAFQLAEILTRSLLLDPKARNHFGAFVVASHRDDAGEAAAIQHLGAGLGHWAGEFLGPGEWAPTAK